MALGLFPLEEVVRRLGPSFVYDLYVAEIEMLSARRFLREINAETGRDSPLAPYINLHAAQFPSQNGWCVAANGRCVGCRGY